MALKKLREHFQETNINEFHRLLKNRVMVVEKISAPSFYVRRNEEKFEFYKSSKSKPLTIIDTCWFLASSFFGDGECKV